MRKVLFTVMTLITLSGSMAFGAFVDNNDGTVTDTSTGLMWQQETAGPMTWEQALSYCETISLAGHNDWRLPIRNELQSLVNYNVYEPSIDITVFPETLPSDYWSSTGYSTNNAITVYFYGGLVWPAIMSSSHYVRAVR